MKKRFFPTIFCVLLLFGCSPANDNTSSISSPLLSTAIVKEEVDVSYFDNIETDNVIDDEKTENPDVNRCIVCNEEITPQQIGETEDFTHFCPNCGYDYSCEICCFPLGENKRCQNCGKATVNRRRSQPNSGVYIMDSEFYRPIEKYSVKMGPFNEYAFSYDLDYDIPILNKSSGETLVTFDARSRYDISPVLLQLYCYPSELLFWGDYEEFHFVDPPMLECFTSHTDVNFCEAEGQIFSSEDEFSEILASRNCFLFESGYSSNDTFICSYEPSSVNLGYYQGTNFLQEDIPVDASFFELDDNFRIPTEKTKDGYFLIDTSSLECGLYVIQLGESGNHVLFEII